MLFVEEYYPVIDGWKVVAINSKAHVWATNINSNYVRYHENVVRIPHVLYVLIDIEYQLSRNSLETVKKYAIPYAEKNDILYQEVLSWDYLKYGDKRVWAGELTTEAVLEVKKELINLMDDILRDNGIEV